MVSTWSQPGPHSLNAKLRLTMTLRCHQSLRSHGGHDHSAVGHLLSVLGFVTSIPAPTPTSLCALFIIRALEVVVGACVCPSFLQLISALSHRYWMNK
ncbi:hypothetical protein FKP32DRAFT_318063 [Trametes sanguinea]|nr:hypothetical protein FKP32DRAFT_318063 [Trametes sanguinea]